MKSAVYAFEMKSNDSNILTSSLTTLLLFKFISEITSSFKYIWLLSTLAISFLTSIPKTSFNFFTTLFVRSFSLTACAFTPVLDK